MPRPSTRKMKAPIRAIATWAEAHGWALQEEKDGNGHWVLRHSGSRAIVRLPDTPGEYRGLENAKAEIRRKSGLANESGPAARYRHEGRQERFDMDQALREQRLRRAHEEVRRRTMLRVSDELDFARAELALINPRRDPDLAREVAAKVLDLEQQLHRGQLDDHEPLQGLPRRPGERDDQQAPEA